jgi:integrase
MPTVNREIVQKCLINALDEFVNSERLLLEQDSHEESISSALIPYLKRHFDFWTHNIDHQYDKRILDDEAVKKTTRFLRNELLPKQIPRLQSKSETIEKEVLPDIIFHDRRSSANNFLVIEIKKSTNRNTADRAYDITKLEKLTTFDLRYTFGAFVDIATGSDIGSRQPFVIKLIEQGTWV